MCIRDRANLYPITASLGMVGYRSYDTAVNWNIGTCSCSLVLAVVISAILISVSYTHLMLNEFVEKILVHERARKGSQDTTQEIEIYFNFLGRYIPPSLQPVPLTPEEQEELRKKEERKDRLHQNYLKRKASGAQKRYENKIKAKKKAEMDAKKALIRAEDMKKGVFSTVGQLPKRCV